jgi:hypothetical protein
VKAPSGVPNMEDSRARSINLLVDNATEGVEVECVGNGLYRLEDSLISAWEDSSVYAGDVIEAEPLPDGTHRLVRVVERSPMRHSFWILPRRYRESSEFDAFLAAVDAAGGRWESVWGGMLWVHLPPESGFDAEGALARGIAASAASHTEGG